MRVERQCVDAVEPVAGRALADLVAQQHAPRLAVGLDAPDRADELARGQEVAGGDELALDRIPGQVLQWEAVGRQCVLRAHAVRAGDRCACRRGRPDAARSRPGRRPTAGRWRRQPRRRCHVLDQGALHRHLVQVASLGGGGAVHHLGVAALEAELTGVAHLAAGEGVEGRAIQQHVPLRR